MAKIIEVKDWDKMSSITLFYLRLASESDLREIAETLNLPFIFKKKNELMCTDGYLQYWFKP